MDVAYYLYTYYHSPIIAYYSNRHDKAKTTPRRTVSNSGRIGGIHWCNIANYLTLGERQAQTPLQIDPQTSKGTEG
jgi:hypothetical protein